MIYSKAFVGMAFTEDSYSQTEDGRIASFREDSQPAKLIVLS